MVDPGRHQAAIQADRHVAEVSGVAIRSVCILHLAGLLAGLGIVAENAPAHVDIQLAVQPGRQVVDVQGGVQAPLHHEFSG